MSDDYGYEAQAVGIEAVYALLQVLDEKIDRIEKAVNRPDPHKHASLRSPGPSTGPGVCLDCGGKVKNPQYSRCFKCNQARKASWSDCPECGSESSVDLDKYDRCYTCNQNTAWSDDEEPF